MKKLQFFVWIFLITALSGTLLSLGGSAGCGQTKTGGDPAGEFCGDNNLNEGEECDDGNTVDDATCLQDCTLPEGKMAECGNGIPELGEQCDGTSLNNQTCLSLGFESGNLVCNPNCLLDTSDCKASNGGSCGDNVINAGEACDGTAVLGEDCTSQGFHSGTLTCQSDCQGYDTSSCVPHGSFLTLQQVSDISGNNHIRFLKDNSGNVYLSGFFRGTSLTLKVNGQDQVFQNSDISGASVDAFLGKIDPNDGTLDWVIQLSGSKDEQVYYLSSDLQGNVYISGYFDGTTMTALVNGMDKTLTRLGANGSDSFLAKLNPANGNLIWLSHVAGESIDGIEHLIVNSDNDLYVSGYFRGPSLEVNGVDAFPIGSNNTNDDAFFGKINKTNGDVIWIKRVLSDGIDYVSLHGNILSNKVYVTGTFYGTSLTLPVNLQNQTLTNMGETSSFWGRINPANGNFLSLQSSSEGGDEQVYLSENALGNLYANGCFSEALAKLPMSDGSIQTLSNSNNGSEDCFFGLIDKNTMKFAWVTHLSSNNNDSQSLYFSPSGDLYIVGSFGGAFLKINGVDQLTNANNGTSDVFIAKINPVDGSVLWMTPIASNSIDSFKLILSSTGDLYMFGYYFGESVTLPVSTGNQTLTNSNEGNSDYLMGRIDPSNGHFVWITPVSSNGSSNALNVSIASSSALYVSGHFTAETISLPVHGETVVLTNIDNSGTTYDSFYGKVNDSNGTFEWVTSISSVDNDNLDSVQDGSGNIYLWGAVSSPLTLPLLEEEVTLTDPVSFDSWFGKIAP